MTGAEASEEDQDEDGKGHQEAAKGTKWLLAALKQHTHAYNEHCALPKQRKANVVLAQS